MALLKTKKPETPNPAATRRTLQDCPAVTRPKRPCGSAFRRRPSSPRTGDSAPDLHAPTGQESRIKKLAAGLMADATGQPEPPEPAEVAIAECRVAVTRAIEQQQVQIEGLRLDLAGQLYRVWEQEHREARAEIARRIVAHEEAIDTEQNLAETMFPHGALTSPRFGKRLWVNVSICCRLPEVFRGLNLKEFARNNRNLLG